jgi:hypothetical protein
MFVGVQVSLGIDNLSGVPVDIAFEDQRSYAGLPGFQSLYSAGAGIPINGKQMIRNTPGCPSVSATNHPRYMFVAVPNPAQGSGVVDVIRIDQGFTRIDTDPFHPGVQSIPAPNVQVLMDYFRE